MLVEHTLCSYDAVAVERIQALELHFSFSVDHSDFRPSKEPWGSSKHTINTPEVVVCLPHTQMYLYGAVLENS